jgi:hypothetical protein
LPLWLACIAIALAARPVMAEPLRQSVRSIDQATQVLRAYLDSLNAGRYSAAVALYRGDYRTLLYWNEDMRGDDLAGLLQRGCEGNGLQCLRMRRVVGHERLTNGDIRLRVELARPDGQLFVRGPCCGSTEAEDPPDSIFSYTVGWDRGALKVLELPPYVP